MLTPAKTTLPPTTSTTSYKSVSKNHSKIKIGHSPSASLNKSLSISLKILTDYKTPEKIPQKSRKNPAKTAENRKQAENRQRIGKKVLVRNFWVGKKC